MKKIYLLVLALPLLFTSCSGDDDSSSSRNSVTIGDNNVELLSGTSEYYGSSQSDNAYNTDITLESVDINFVFDADNIDSDDIDTDAVSDLESASFYIEAFSPLNNSLNLSEGTYVNDSDQGSEGEFTFSEAAVNYTNSTGILVEYTILDGTLTVEKSEATSDDISFYEIEFRGTTTSGVEIEVSYEGELNHSVNSSSAKGLKNK